jgi:hypothetical protein
MPFSFWRLFRRGSSKTTSNPSSDIQRQLIALANEVEQGNSLMADALYRIEHQLRGLVDQIEQGRILAAQPILLRLREQRETVPLRQTEFKVFSQFGDDGIIQFIINRLRIPSEEQQFIEFGVENYRESNTRFLLLNDNWTGLVMDGSEVHINFIRQDSVFWKHDLTAQAHFITRENINSLIRNAGFKGRIGLLSIDVDGNDYWIWEAVNIVDPAIVIVEYNSLFGSSEAVTIPYQADFKRENAHYSYLYWGTSLRALCHLAAQKDYVWIGCNSAGNNAYFVRKPDAAPFHSPSLPEGFVAAKFREGRDEHGKLAYTSQAESFVLLADLPVWDVLSQKMRPISDLNR